jgi:hypothetical protein
MLYKSLEGGTPIESILSPEIGSINKIGKRHGINLVRKILVFIINNL